MGGWITQIGNISDFDKRLARFEKTFNVDGVPSLRVEAHKHTDSAGTAIWAWNRFGIPDVYTHKTSEGAFIVLCGVITDLGRFGTPPNDRESTAPLLLKLWIEHKESLIKELNGSFSCLFYEPDKKQTTLYTDRFCSRSVWFTKENDLWIVGDFPSALAAMKKSGLKIAPVGLWSLLHTGRHVGKHGLYSNIQCLSAGGEAILSASPQATIDKWIQRRYTPENSVKTSDWGARIAAALKESSQRYKNVCRKPYIFLSGGLDSRIAAAAFGRPLKSISFANMPNAETKIASIVSKVVGIDHKTIIRSPYWYLNTFDASALISAGNFLTCHSHFIVPASEIASENPDAEFLLGDLLENFNKHYFSQINGQYPNYQPQNMMAILHSHVPYSLKNTQRLGIHIRQELRQKIEKTYREALSDFAESLLDVSENDADRLDTFLRWADVSVTPTYNMLTCLRTVAAERNIFFDNQVNDINLKIPAALRDNGILHKQILQHLNKMLPLIPDANTFLPPIMPKSIGTLTKKIRPTLGKIRRSAALKSKNKPVLKTSGSWGMMHQMYRKDPLYKGKIEELILDGNIFPEEIFDASSIKNTWEEYLAGDISLHIEINALLSFGLLNKLLPFNGIEF